MDETQRLYSVAILDAIERNKTTMQQVIGFTCAATLRPLSRVHFEHAMEWVKANGLIADNKVTTKGKGYLLAWDT